MSAADSTDIIDLRRSIVIAGYRGRLVEVENALTHPHPSVREAALGAMARLEWLTAERLTSFMTDVDPRVRIRVAELGAAFRDIDLTLLLDDTDHSVVEVACWACGEHENPRPEIMTRLSALATTHDDALVREAAVAALGAIGDEAGLSAILQACQDKPTIRRRAVLALAPFDSPEVRNALTVALEDRDWQVRQAAEDLLG